MQRTSTHPARLDVLAVSLATVNEVLYLRLRDVIRPQIGMNLGDIHAIIDWLSGMILYNVIDHFM